MGMQVDGNALAGPLSEIFRLDATAARGMCAHCGQEAPLAAMIVHRSEMGDVGACAGCGNVLMTLVRTATETVFSASGLVRVRFAR